MSRTYKDRPDRVKTADKKLKNAHEYHYCNFMGRETECLIDEIQPPDKHGVRCIRYTGDNSEPLDKDARKTCHRSHRQEERDVLGKIALEYNSQGTIENDCLLTPHVKNALFGGGYWN